MTSKYPDKRAFAIIGTHLAADLVCFLLYTRAEMPWPKILWLSRMKIYQ
jgi:hypothetical protein